MFAGLVFDGQLSAAVGFEHDAHSPGLFETRIRHQNSKWINFGTAGIRIGFNTTGGKLETSEVLYENLVFANNGHACGTTGTEGFPGCGGIAILNFNDYDNTFDGCHFSDNSYGITTDKMANVYVRNSRFERSTVADIVLAPSAGNSVRRCVSVGSRVFVTSPHHTASNPATIQDCRVYNWTGLAAVTYNLRGPLTLLDNQFVGAASKGGGVAVDGTPWPQTNQVVMAAGNTVNGAAVGAHQLVRQPSTKNVFLYDLSDTGVASKATAALDSTSTFLKQWWPVPTAFIDATTHGCTGEAKDDATACAQATINEAAAKGRGVAAYFPTGTYSINSSLSIKAGNYSVMGAGFTTIFAWSGHTSAIPAVVVVQGGGSGLRLTHFSVRCGGNAMAYDTNLLHDGTVPTEGGEGGETGARTTTYDEVYTGSTNALWNATGVEVRGLGARDTAHFIHIDGNVKVHDSARGTPPQSQYNKYIIIIAVRRLSPNIIKMLL